MPPQRITTFILIPTPGLKLHDYGTSLSIIDDQQRSYLAMFHI